MSDRLFDIPDLPPLEKLSADQRRTIRQRESIASGVHPVSREPLLRDSDETCGSCGHLVEVDWRSKRFFKCYLVTPTHGPGTDLRKWWPACRLWGSTPDTTSGMTLDELIADIDAVLRSR